MAKEEILREFPPMGKYRIRMIRETMRNGTIKESHLDIREYVSSETFEGFTRRGIKIPGIRELMLLQEILSTIIEECRVVKDPYDIEIKRQPVDQKQVEIYKALAEAKDAPGPSETQRKVALFKEVMTMPKECPSCGVLESVARYGLNGGDCPEHHNPHTVQSEPKEERKEVQMTTCTLCQREMPAAGPQSGIGYKEETLCGVCLKAAQRVCPHALRKEDGVTCRDCGARPWSAGRVIKGVSIFMVKAGAGIAKVFVLYTLQAILGSAVTLGLAYFAAKKMGFLP